jgi:asparagine synthase (glutamine-hydrolysing)
MCAIHGIFKRDVNTIEKMVDMAHHRGPDGDGVWHDNFITLGHNLLSIVDEEINSKQPWIYENLVLVYNGEIYNYKELGKEFNLETNTDTEVIIKGIAKYGHSFLDKLDGMFGLACYNKTTKQLTLARDSNGIKPVYYGFHNHTLYFSSEIKSLLEVGFERRVNKKALSHYHKLGYNSGYLTMFEGIQKLVPGEVRIYDVIEGNVIESRNLNNYQYDFKGFSIEEIQERINQSVKQTLMGRRNIGLFLSGGMDSTSILYEMLSLDVKPKTFTTAFDTIDPHSRLNEDSKIAKGLAGDLKVENHALFQSQNDYVDALEDAFYALEEPRQGKSFPSYYNTNKFLAKNNITVTLAGDGGDELFAGYKHHLNPDWELNIARLCGKNKILKNKELSCSADDLMNYMYEWLPTKPMTGDKLNDFLYIESLTNLAEDFFIRNDKLGMAFGMEGRFPYMNKTIRDYIRAIPSKLKVHEDFAKNPTLYNKKLQKSAYAGKLPQYIINHPKTGWRFPTDEILIGSWGEVREWHPAPDTGILKDYIRSVLQDKELQELFEFDNTDIEKRYLNNKDHADIMEGHKAGPGLLAQKELFLILNFAVWKKVFKVSL